jgi:hypothetical protein
MGIQAGVGMSHHRNPRVAGREAAQKALDAAGVEKPDFGFAFATAGYEQRALLSAVRETTGGASLCGCSAEGVIAEGEADESSFAVGVMVLRSDTLRFSHGMVTGLQADPAGAGRAIAEAIRPEVGTDTLALFLFPDGLTVNFDRLQAGLEGQLSLGRLLPLVGGTASTYPGLRTCYQYFDDDVVSDGVAWALLSGEARIAWVVNHGCVPVGAEGKITRCERNVIYEVDGQPALGALTDMITVDQIEDRLRTGLTFPLGFKAPGHLRDRDEYTIRAMMDADGSTGAVTIPTEVSEGTGVWVTHRDYEKLAQGVRGAAEEIKAQLGDDPAKLVFQFDCAARGKIFLREQQKLELLETLRGRIGLDVPWLGFYTYGEIAPVGAYNCFHNFTLALMVLY